MNAWTVLEGTFLWFFFQWAFRVLALVTIGKGIGRAVGEVKNKIGGKGNDNGNSNASQV